MGSELLHLGTVTCSLLLLIVLPFVPITFLLFRGKQWPKILLSATVLGGSLQASIGMVWSHVAGVKPLAELGVFASAWLILLGCSIWRNARRTSLIWDPDETPFHAGLIITLIVGFIIRIIHPLDVAYLGQSDAYTHLNYIHNIAEFGLLFNPVYPSGYHWIMALPSLIFSIDPYQTARFGGAFWGLSMVLGIYVLMEQCLSRRAALFASFCAAAFPGMNLLMKTGVGVFANQFGLILLPAIFLFYILSISTRGWKSGDHLLLAMSLCGLVAAVPMMLFHVLLVLGFERLVMLMRTPRKWLPKTFQLAILLLPALFLFAFHLSQVGGGQRFKTAEIMTDHGDANVTSIEKLADKVEKEITEKKPHREKIAKLVFQSPYFKLLTDFFSVKRLGFGNSKLDTLAAVLAGLFLILLMIGLVRQGTSYIVIGLWGLLTSVQAGTGLLQFSSYQREGWSLLIATCCLSGIIASNVYRFGEQSRLFRLVVFVVMVVSFSWSVIHPPFHFPMRSNAEDELVSTIRYLGNKPWVLTNECGDEKKNTPICNLTALLSDDLEVVLVTRRFVGWGNQGEIALNVKPIDSTLPVLIVDHKQKDDIFRTGKQYVALVDERNGISGQQMISAFAMVTPSMVEATMNNRKQMFRLNEIITEQIESLPDYRWKVTRIEISDNLSAYVLVPSA